MNDQEIQKINLSIAAATGLGIVTLLLCATMFAQRQHAFFIGVLLSIAALCAVLLLVIRCKGFSAALAREKQSQLDQKLLSSFTTEHFVQGCEDMVRKSSKRYAFLFFTLVDFEDYNEKFGRVAGDELLMSICRVLQQMEHTDRKFARCFGIYFEGLLPYEDEDEITAFFEELQQSFPKLAFAFGVSLVTFSHQNLNVCEERAQNALKIARQEDRPYEFARELDREQLRNMILQNMDDALANNEFAMYLQPRYDLQTGQICGAEALVRWIKPDGTIVFPQDMISIFEETGFITKLDMVILKQACIKIRQWIDKGYTPLPISINISKLHILDVTFVSGLAKMIKEYKIPTDILEFDISQTSISVKMDKLLALNREFDGRELMVYMDDSGCNSSIKILENLPGDTVKLGSDFFHIALQNPKVYDAIYKIIDLFYKKNVKVIAERIETEEQVELLKRLNCQVAQGFYFSRPVSLAQFDKIAFASSKKPVTR